MSLSKPKMYLITGRDCRDCAIDEVAVAHSAEEAAGMIRQVLHSAEPLRIYELTLPIGRGLAGQDLRLRTFLGKGVAA